MLSYCFCLLDGRESMIIWEEKLFLMEALFGLTPEVSLTVIDCLLPQADRKLTRFAATNWEADWFLGCWNYFHDLSGLESSSYWPWAYSVRVDVSRRGCRGCDMSLCLQHVWWYCPIFPTHLWIHIHKCESAVAMPPSAAKLQVVFTHKWNIPQMLDS